MRINYRLAMAGVGGAHSEQIDSSRRDGERERGGLGVGGTRAAEVHYGECPPRALRPGGGIGAGERAAAEGYGVSTCLSQADWMAPTLARWSLLL